MNPYTPTQAGTTTVPSYPVVQWERVPTFCLVVLAPLLANIACRVSLALGISLFAGVTLTAWTISTVRRNRTALFNGTLCSFMIWGAVSFLIVLVRPAIFGPNGHILPRLGPVLNVTSDRALLLVAWPIVQISLMLGWLFVTDILVRLKILRS